MTVLLGCTISNEVPRPVPPPTITWLRNSVPAASASFGGHFDVDMDFLMQFPILTTGVFSGYFGAIGPIFQVLISGELFFSTEFINITNPMLGNLPESTTRRQVRAMLFDILLANWTCVANNSLGTSAVEHHIGMCGKLDVKTDSSIL